MHFQVYHQFHDLEIIMTCEDLCSHLFVCWVGVVGRILALVISPVLHLELYVIW